MKTKGNIIELVISLLLIFIIILDFLLLFNFNFKVIKRIEYRYELAILENNLQNILRRDLFFNKRIGNYELKTKGKEYFIKTNKNFYYLGTFKYFKIKGVKINEERVSLDKIEIGKIKYIKINLDKKQEKFILE